LIQLLLQFVTSELCPFFCAISFKKVLQQLEKKLKLNAGTLAAADVQRTIVTRLTTLVRKRVSGKGAKKKRKPARAL
jgi:hypothetical protein